MNPFEPSVFSPGPVRPLDPATGAVLKPPRGRRQRLLERGLAASVGHEIVQGRFCGRIEHAISRHNLRSHRCAFTGACLACLADARAGKVSFASGLDPSAQSRLLSFLAMVTITEHGIGGEWGWIGPKRGGSAIYRGLGGSISARRAAFMLLRADLGPAVELRQSCTGRAQCVNPFHVRAPAFGIAALDAKTYEAELLRLWARAQARSKR